LDIKVPISGKPEIGAPRNDSSHYRLSCVTIRFFHSSTRAA
jgi:hypothetical protein